MPEISRFFGIIVFINYNEHNPPHFHRWFDEYKISLDVGHLGGVVPHLIGT
ncbi:MAG: DUF4160 domain-containing protein [Saprospiraceae bacterium]|nr:DUF4160 domain-containing protein [Saprospiraceae bacterium]